MTQRSESTVLIVNPSPDIYGSDLQMLESVQSLVDHGWRVVVATTHDGPLCSMVTRRGGHVVLVDFPVLRRAHASPQGLVFLTLSIARALPRMIRLVRSVAPQVVYVNTLTLPWWLMVGRITGRPTLCHVHEAEAKDSLVVRTALQSPVTLASNVIVNSHATMETLCKVVPWVRARCRLVYNGVEGPGVEPEPPYPGCDPFVMAVVGRLSPRKGVDVALECAALLVARGRRIRLLVCGTPFSGYEWFEADLRARAARDDLCGSVDFLGYVDPLWPTLAQTCAVLAPSFGESLGNAVIQGQLAKRPVVATAVQGHLETIQDGMTGLLVEPGDPAAMANAVERLMEDQLFAERLGSTARSEALRRFSTGRYGDQLVAVVSSLVRHPRSRSLRR